jgi:hypothetical protein
MRLIVALFLLFCCIRPPQLSSVERHASGNGACANDRWNVGSKHSGDVAAAVLVGEGDEMCHATSSIQGPKFVARHEGDCVAPQTPFCHGQEASLAAEQAQGQGAAAATNVATTHRMPVRAALRGSITRWPQAIGSSSSSTRGSTMLGVRMGVTPLPSSCSWAKDRVVQYTAGAFGSQQNY